MLDRMPPSTPPSRFCDDPGGERQDDRGKPVRVLHVVRGMPNSSGMTYVVRPLAEEQARLGADVAIWICETPGETPTMPDKALVDWRIFPVSLPFYNPGISLPFARALSRAIGDFDFIHIHAVWNFPTWWTMRCAARAGVPFMVAPRGSFDPWAMRWHGRRKALYARLTELPLINRAWAVHALTAAEAGHTRTLGVTAPVKIVPNGVDPSWFDCVALDLADRFGTPTGARTVLSLSRLHPKKGIDILIRGFAELAAAAPDVHLLIAGQDYQSGYGDMLKQIVAAYSLEQRIHFIGEIRGAEKYRLLRSVDAFALISHSEGMPLGVLEAMAAGLPVIITPGCYIPEAAEAGAGIMVNTEPAEVGRALEAVFLRDGAMAEMGRAGERLIKERFTWRSIAQQTLALYRQARQERHELRSPARPTTAAASAETADRAVDNTAASEPGPKPPIKVLCCNGTWPDDGASGPVQSLLGLTRALSSEFEFKVISRQFKPAAPAWKRQPSLDRYTCTMAPWGPRGFRRLLRSTPHDMLLLNGFFDREFTLPALVLRRLGLIPRRPTILSPRGEFSPGALTLKAWRKQIYLTVVRSLGLLDGVWLHAVGEDEAVAIRTACPWVPRIVVAPNIRTLQPMPAMPQTDAAQRALRLVFLSRIDRKKNLDYALLVLGKLSVPAVMDIYGPVSDSAYWSKCQRMIANLPTHVAANYLGVVPNDAVRATLSHYDLFFLPTRGENFGHAIFDALEAGVPVLVSDQTPWRDLGDAGFSLPLGNPAAFAATIQQFGRLSADLRTNMRLAARATVENYVSNNKSAIARNRSMLFAALQEGSP